tara:strand:- start:293 stop:790 length:498 start_codon:yes stop_codon:yes gene_type:complete
MSTDISPEMLQGAIPGMSLTQEPQAMPWENPPELSTIEELIEYYTERLLDTDTENSILFALDEGISVEMIAEFVSTSGTMNGRHSLDLAFLINPFIRELVRYIGETANISYVDSYSEREKKKEVPYRQMREVVKEVFDEMPETTMIQPKEPSPKGLMARLSKEEE